MSCYCGHLLKSSRRVKGLKKEYLILLLNKIIDTCIYLGMKCLMSETFFHMQILAPISSDRRGEKIGMISA